MIKRFAGRTKIIYLKKADSVAIDAGEMVKFSTADPGFVAPSTGDTDERLIGVARDSYASDTTNELVAIEVPTEPWVEWEFDTDSDGGLADTDVGYYRGLDTLGANIDVSLTNNETFLVTKKISTTKGVGILVSTVVNSAYATMYAGT